MDNRSLLKFVRTSFVINLKVMILLLLIKIIHHGLFSSFYAKNVLLNAVTHVHNRDNTSARFENNEIALNNNMFLTSEPCFKLVVLTFNQMRSYANTNGSWRQDLGEVNFGSHGC